MEKLDELAKKHLSFLSEKIKSRCVGCTGNLLASDYFKQQLESNNWQIESQEFMAFDWESECAGIEIGRLKINAFSSPYSDSCDIISEVVIVSTIEELEKADVKNKILIVKGELASEKLMPKNFVFYNPVHHRKIIDLFETSRALALIFIVSKSGFYEGGEYPFPIIEDGDFRIPSVFVSEKDGEALLNRKYEKLKLISKTKKAPSKGYNYIGRKGLNSSKKITITAHIDSKKGSPGAIDNATGVVTLILLSVLLKHYHEDYEIELVALNGEDYYSVPGQMMYIEKNKDNFNKTVLNINIDGVGLNIGKTSYALMNLSKIQSDEVKKVFNQFSGLIEVKPWVQGDHSIFLQFGIPAIAISSEWLLDNLQVQRITHTENDNMSITDIHKIVELARAIRTLIYML